MILPIHIAAGVVALVSGAWNLLTRKGTRRHRRIGWIYAVSMGILIATSFGILELYGGFGPFHVMSAVSGLTLAFAMYYPLRRTRYPNWLEHHYFWITYSYVGLLMATGSHLFEYGPPGWPDWARVLLYWGLPLAAGVLLIYGNRHRTLGRFQALHQ